MSTSRTTIITDLPCIHCGYNLRTVDLVAPCPECGRLADESLDSLALADPADLARVLSGIRLMLLAALLFPVLFLCMTILARLGRPGDWAGYLAGAGVCMAGPILAMLGARRFGARIRRFDRSRSSPFRSRWQGAKWPSVLGCGYFCCVGIGYASIVADRLNLIDLADRDLVPMALFGVGGVFWLFRNAAVCRRGAWLAGQANSPGIARTLVWCSRLAIVCAIGCLPIGAVGFALTVAERIYHVAVFDLRIGGMSSPGQAITTLAAVFLYASLFGWLVLNPATLILLQRSIAGADRLARARAGGPVLQTAEPGPSR